MKAQELWNQYKDIKPEIGENIDAWAFGAESDLLADLVLKGIKTATTSAYDLYQVEGASLPQVGSYDVLLDSQDNAICIIQVTKVNICPFEEVSADHAFKEGEGDKSLGWWRKAHEKFFRLCFEEFGLIFTEECQLVLEEFEVVYPLREE